MTEEIKAILKEALDMKLASVKRARNTNKNPRFSAIYDTEEEIAMKAVAWLATQKTT